MIYHEWNKKAWIAGVILATSILVLLLSRIPGCGKSDTVIVPPAPAPAPEPAPPPAPPPGPPPPDCGAPGDIRQTACAAGQTGTTAQVCTADGWKDVSSTCSTSLPPPCDQVTTFDELAPVIALNCVGCHNGFDAYDKMTTGKTKTDAPLYPEVLRRIQLPTNDAAHMPAQRPSLGDRDVALFKSWDANGRLPAGGCTGVPPPPKTAVDFPTVEAELLANVNRVAPGDQTNTRYLTAIDVLNFGTTEALAVAQQAAAKAVNSVSTNRTIRPLVDVAPGVWRINIADLGISPADWKAIEDASQLQFESFTNVGKTLKGITGARLPWMNVADFNDTVLHNSTVYYRLTKAPATFNKLVAQLGVKFVADLLDFKATLLAFNGSSLSLAANRLIARFDSDDGDFWLTQDTGKIVSDAQSVFKNPLIFGSGGQANLKCAAGEMLYSLPNGLMGSFLAACKQVFRNEVQKDAQGRPVKDAQGRDVIVQVFDHSEFDQRLDAADPAVVHDFRTGPLSPTIVNAVSCSGCHSGGKIPAVDKVRAAIAGSGIGADDTQRALALYKPQATLDKAFADDNRRFLAALAQAGVDATKPDPIDRVSDGFLGDLSAERVTGLLNFTTLGQLADCLNLSPNGKQQAGQLLTGSPVSHDQFVQVVKDLLRDCRVFQDPQ